MFGERENKWGGERHDGTPGAGHENTQWSEHLHDREEISEGPNGVFAAQKKTF